MFMMWCSCVFHNDVACIDDGFFFSLFQSPLVRDSSFLVIPHHWCVSLTLCIFLFWITLGAGFWFSCNPAPLVVSLLFALFLYLFVTVCAGFWFLILLLCWSFAFLVSSFFLSVFLCVRFVCVILIGGLMCGCFLFGSLMFLCTVVWDFIVSSLHYQWANLRMWILFVNVCFYCY